MTLPVPSSPVRGLLLATSAFPVLVACSHIEPLQFEPAPGAGAPAVRAVPTFDHSAFDALVRKHVGPDGLVDYRGFLQDESALRAYLATFAAVPADGLASDAERKAYWINAYNAVTLAGILHHYPTDSIRDLGGFWDRVLTNCGGRNVSLNDIEHRILRPMGDPRIHVAINCASMGCPELRAEAYAAERLDEQLDEAARRFLGDPARNRFEAGSPTRARISRIFSWFGSDFGVAPYRGVPGFLRRYGPTPARQAEEFAIDYLDYDWSLNDAAKR